MLPARRGCSLVYRGLTLLSRIDPMARAEAAVAAATGAAGDRTLYFCPSPLFGYGLEKLLGELDAGASAGAGAGAAVLALELDGALLALSREAIARDYPLAASHPRFLLTGCGDAAALAALLRETWGGRSFRRVVSLKLTGGWQLFPERYEVLADALRREIALDWGNAMTLVRLGRRFALNFVRNLALEGRDLAGLSYGDVPLLVLGAGPSLDPFLDGLVAGFGDLSNTAGRPFRIICVDTALGSLRERDIRPDLVLALESQHWNLRDFTGLGDWRLPLAMDLSALPATAQFAGARPWLFFTPWTRLRLFERLEAAGALPIKFPPLGSVGLSAVYAALHLGRGYVIVAGIDFSFSLDAYHARGSPGHRERLRSQNRLCSLIRPGPVFRPGATDAFSSEGRPVRTDPAMRSYRELFRREFAGEDRLAAVAGTGLDLGVRTLPLETALGLLGETALGLLGAFVKEADEDKPPERAVKRYEAPLEIARLRRLRDLLTGLAAPEPAELEDLLDASDYLWAHFPECAAAEGRRPPGTNLSFLKRVRAELEPFLNAWERSGGAA
jgi:hypothetical protein